MLVFLSSFCYNGEGNIEFYRTENGDITVIGQEFIALIFFATVGGLVVFSIVYKQYSKWRQIAESIARANAHRTRKGDRYKHDSALTRGCPLSLPHKSAINSFHHKGTKVLLSRLLVTLCLRGSSKNAKRWQISKSATDNVSSRVRI